MKIKKSYGDPASHNSPEQKKEKELLFNVTEETTLLPFLVEKLKDHSRSHIKSLLAHRQVVINKTASTKFDAPLKPGMTVHINKTGVKESFNHSMVRIVFEDSHLLVIEKKEGLLSIANDKTRDKTAFFILSEYVKKRHHTNRIFVVHRLDRETSGLMIYAKKQEVQEIMQNNWHDCIVERKYYTVLEGTLEQSEGKIGSYLSENKNLKVFANPKGEGQLAITNFKVLRNNNEYSLVEMELETGRKNQIRAHAEYIGHSIAGDKKYGAKTNPLRRVALHAYKLHFIHPITREMMRFETDLPKGFASIVR